MAEGSSCLFGPGKVGLCQPVTPAEMVEECRDRQRFSCQEQSPAHRTTKIIGFVGRGQLITDETREKR